MGSISIMFYSSLLALPLLRIRYGIPHSAADSAFKFQLSSPSTSQ
jgi:hypothetical protein